ncbi:MAG: hypothetical protein ACTSPX_06145 [Candidatus Thorarchaeota archaeon]
MSEIYSRRVYKFKPRHGHQIHLGAAEIRAAVLNLGKEVLGNEFTAEVISEDDGTILVSCSAATGQLVDEMDQKLMVKIINFCEKHGLSVQVGEMEVMTPDEDWV